MRPVPTPTVSAAESERLPICLACFRQGVSMDDEPPATYVSGWACEDCAFRTFEEDEALAHSDEHKHSLARWAKRTWPEETCSVAVCARRTNNGIYVDAQTVHQITLVLARM